MTVVSEPIETVNMQPAASPDLHSAAERLRARRRKSRRSNSYDLRTVNQFFSTDSNSAAQKMNPIPVSFKNDQNMDPSIANKPAEDNNVPCGGGGGSSSRRRHENHHARHSVASRCDDDDPRAAGSQTFSSAVSHKLDAVAAATPAPPQEHDAARPPSQSFFSAVKKSLGSSPEGTHDEPCGASTMARPAAKRISAPSVPRMPSMHQPPQGQIPPHNINNNNNCVPPNHNNNMPQQQQQTMPCNNNMMQMPANWQFIPMQAFPANWQFVLPMQQQQQHNMVPMQVVPEAAPQPKPLPSNNWNNVPRRRKKKRSPEQKYKMIKASWYHSIASKNRLGAIGEDPVVFSDSDREEQRKNSTPLGLLHFISEQQVQAKRTLLKELNENRGELTTQAFQAALQQLVSTYDPSHFDPRRLRTTYVGNCLEGIGISAGKPTFPGHLGYNAQGDPMYKLGRMSFDMFCPTQLVLSVQGTFVLIDTVDPRDPEKIKHVPSNLREEVQRGTTPVRTYNIVTPCTIEAWRPEFGEDSPNKGVEQPIRGVMTTYGFILPYPKGHRFSVWFTGGSLEMDGNKNEKWFQIFDKDTAPKRSFVETGKVFAAKLLMGASTNDAMDANGRLTYALNRPMASHIDLIYLDQRMQIFRGSSGTVYVHVRIPGSHAVNQCVKGDQLIPAPRDPCGDDDDDDDDSSSGSWDDLGGMGLHRPILQQPIRPQPIRHQPAPVRVQPVPVRIKPVPRRVSSDGDLQNLCPGIRRDSSSKSLSSQGEAPKRGVRRTKSCLKEASVYEAPKRAWYLDTEVA